MSERSAAKYNLREKNYGHRDSSRVNNFCAPFSLEYSSIKMPWLPGLSDNTETALGVSREG